MTWWEALLLGIVEGVTEYLPVSSTGHLILVSSWLGLDDETRREAVFAFNIVIQFGAILAVLGLYRARIAQMLRGVIGKDEEGRRLAILLIVAFVPAAVLGLLLEERIENYLDGAWPVTGALFVGGWLMLLVAKSRKLQSLTGEDAAGRTLTDMDVRMALLIGFGQCVAMWPGTSRSMMTIVTAMLLGFQAKAAAEFSFLLGLITLTAASGYKAATGYEAIAEHVGIMPLIVGVTAAAISAALAVRWFVNALNKYGLAPFGWYRIGLAILMVVLLLSAS